MERGRLRRLHARTWAIIVASLLILVGGGMAFAWMQSTRTAGPQAEGPSAPPHAKTDKAQTIHVAESGADDAAGSEKEPLKTIEAAIKKSNAGDKIVVHGGTYREALKIENRPGLIITAAPNETVWLDGAEPVENWQQAGDLWVSPGWTADFDSSPTYKWGDPDGTKAGWQFVNPQYPMAAHPDQVWIDGERLDQVGSKDEVEPGKFYVDYVSDELFLGDDPDSHLVTASTLTRALRVRSPQVQIRGIGVRHYASSVPHMGAITIEASDVVLDQLSVSDNATTGVHVLSSGVRLRHVDLERNGMMGLSATGADRLYLDHVSARNNNIERFNQSPAAGGIKIGRSSDITVRDSDFVDNLANGVWFDESVAGITLINNRVIGNSGHGVSIEISGRATVVGNVIARNRDNGIKINDSEDVRVWNNTFVDNNRSINVVQDSRDLDPNGSYRDPDSELDWKTQGVAIRNNVIVNSGTVPAPASIDPARNCLLCVEDFSGRWTAAEMDVTALGNVYERPDAGSPKWIVVWSRRDKDPYVFRTVEEFRRTVHQEDAGAMLEGTPLLTDDYRARPILTGLVAKTAQPLPDDLAALAGVPVGTRHLGAWIA